MKCKYCGKREFNHITRYVQYIQYDDDDEVANSELEECLGDEKDSHYCINCNRDLKDSELVPG